MWCVLFILGRVNIQVAVSAKRKISKKNRKPIENEKNEMKTEGKSEKMSLKVLSLEKGRSKMMNEKGPI